MAGSLYREGPAQTESAILGLARFRGAHRPCPPVDHMARETRAGWRSQSQASDGTLGSYSAVYVCRAVPARLVRASAFVASKVAGPASTSGAVAQRQRASLAWKRSRVRFPPAPLQASHYEPSTWCIGAGVGNSARSAVCWTSEGQVLDVRVEQEFRGEASPDHESRTFAATRGWSMGRRRWRGRRHGATGSRAGRRSSPTRTLRARRGQRSSRSVPTPRGRPARV